MRAYISVSYQKRGELQEVIHAISSVLLRHAIEPFVFVDNYSFRMDEESAMMSRAVKDIAQSDLLIAETSDKAIGIGVEAGYAKGLKIPVIYLRHQTASHSTTVAGVSDVQVIYGNEKDLKDQLDAALQQLKLDIPKT